MKTVYQDPKQNGCGGACLAMLAHISLEEANARLYPQGRIKRVGWPAILDVLRSAGRNCVAEKLVRLSGARSLKSLSGDALIYGETSKPDGTDVSKHWLVWDHKEQALRDPMGFARRVRLISVLELTTRD